MRAGHAPGLRACGHYSRCSRFARPGEAGHNERGGHDNITVILIGVPSLDATQPAKKKGFLESLLGE